EILDLVRAEGDRWSEYECLRALVQLEIERHVVPAESRYTTELVEVAAKMGDGSTVHVAGALASLLALRRGEPGACEAIEAAIVPLRDVDAKGMLAYTLTIAAEADIEAGRFDDAEKRADEALAAASAVGRRSQMTLARTLLSRVALGRGNATLGR